MVTVTLAPAQTLVEAREGFIGAVGAEYGAAKVYAQTLVAEFGSVWVDAAHDAPGADMDLFRIERAELYKGLKSAGHSNPSVKLKQIKDHARAILAREAAAEDGEGEGAGESAGGEKKERRSVQLRMVEELVALYKFAKKSVLNEAQANAFRSIGQALKDLGVNPEGVE